MTMVVSFCLTPGLGFIAADTRRWEVDRSGNPRRAHVECSKIRHLRSGGFAGLTGVHELSSAVVKAYEDNGDMRTAGEEWLAAQEDAFRDADMVQELTNAFVHRLAPDGAGGLVLEELDWRKNTAQRHPLQMVPPRGAMFSHPLGSTVSSLQRFVQKWIDGVNVAIARSFPGASLGRVGRNEPCPCGSGAKYKKCHGHGPSVAQPEAAAPLAEDLLSTLLPTLVRITAHLFVAVATRYGGPEGPMSDCVEVGILFAEGGNLGEFALGPVPASSLVRAPDNEITTQMQPW